MDHIDRARPEIKSAKKLGRVRYEPDENHDNEGFGPAAMTDNIWMLINVYRIS
jgi:hypothetical protein